MLVTNYSPILVLALLYSYVAKLWHMIRTGSYNIYIYIYIYTTVILYWDRYGSYNTEHRFSYIMPLYCVVLCVCVCVCVRVCVCGVCVRVAE